MNNSREQAGLSVEAVDALEGRTLDAAIATYIMGWKKVRTNDVAWYGQPPGVVWSTEDVPSYSTSIEAAWQVVEHLWNTTGLPVNMGRNYGLSGTSKGWSCRFGGLDNDVYAIAETMPLAIARAALKAALTTGAA